MPRIIVLDSFPLSSTAKREPNSGVTPTVSDECQQWVKDCVKAGNRLIVPSIVYYEVLRELERLAAKTQIDRLKSFCRATSDRYIALTDLHLEHAAKLWAQTCNAGLATAANDALDIDILLVAQILSLNLRPSDFIIATTNVRHLARFVPADLWTNIEP